jgi:hypothetical protein
MLSLTLIEQKVAKKAKDGRWRKEGAGRPFSLVRGMDGEIVAGCGKFGESDSRRLSGVGDDFLGMEKE